MNVGDLIKELQEFPELSTVFVRQDAGIQRLTSVHAMSTKSKDGGIHGPFNRVTPHAEDFGVLLYG